jgi:hypothetical protein
MPKDWGKQYLQEGIDVAEALDAGVISRKNIITEASYEAKGKYYVITVLRLKEQVGGIEDTFIVWLVRTSTMSGYGSVVGYGTILEGPITSVAAIAVIKSGHRRRGIYQKVLKTIVRAKGRPLKGITQSVGSRAAWLAAGAREIEDGSMVLMPRMVKNNPRTGLIATSTQRFLDKGYVIPSAVQAQMDKGELVNATSPFAPLPVFEYAKGDSLFLAVDHPTKSKRQFKDKPRFSVINGDNGQSVYAGGDINKAIQKLKRENR